MIDLKPALSMEQLDARILRDFEAEKNKQFKNALNHLYPSKLIPVIIRRSGIEPDKQVNAVTREERRRLAEVTKHFTLTLTGLRGFNEAIITQGGVTVKEVNPSTMESKKLPGFILQGKCWISMQSRAATTYKLRGRPVCWQDGAQRKIMNYNDMKKGKQNAD